MKHGGGRNDRQADSRPESVNQFAELHRHRLTGIIPARSIPDRLREFLAVANLVETTVVNIRAPAPLARGATGIPVNRQSLASRRACFSFVKRLGQNVSALRTLTIMCALLAALSIPFSAQAQVYSPQGRLTLQTNTPVMTADVVGTSTVYYTPYVGNSIPLYNGTSWSNYQFTQLTLTLNSTYGQSGYIYDIYAFLYDGTPTIGAVAEGWTSAASRSSTPVLQNGIWANSNNDSNYLNGSSNYGGAGQPLIYPTYLGSVYMTSNGKTTVQFKPSAAAGGTNNVIGIWNAYNRVPIYSIESDSNTSWTTTGTSWEPFDVSGTGSGLYNRVTYIDGLGQSSVSGRVTTVSFNSTQYLGTFIGITQDSSSNTPIQIAFADSPAAGNGHGAVAFDVEESFLPALGLHYLQAMQAALQGGTSTLPSIPMTPPSSIEASINPNL